MAIVVGSIVAVKIISSALAAGVSATPPAFGVSQSASAPFDIVWQSGALTEALLATALDEITDAGDSATALVGKVVLGQDAGAAGASPAYSGVVVSAYKRSGTDYLLVRTESGFFIELLAVSVTVLAGQ